MKTIITILLIAVGFHANAQDKFFTRNGTITFFSTTPVEDIKAENFGVTAILDTKTGNLEFSLLMKSFNFKKALMQEHFNENYVESDAFPKSTFSGTIINLPDVNFEKEGEYPAKVKGELMIHGQTREIMVDGTIEVTSEGVVLSSEFPVSPADYEIEIPSVVEDKIAKQILVTVNTELEPLKR